VHSVNVQESTSWYVSSEEGLELWEKSRTLDHHLQNIIVQLH